MPKLKKLYITTSPKATISLGRRIAGCLRPGDIVLLYGELGSGKTVLTKGICLGLGVKEEVTSSSFVIVTEYKGIMPVSHIDLYRLDTKDTNDLPLEEYCSEKGVTIIEWAERITNNQGLTVRITFKAKNKREFTIEDFRN